MELYIHIPFCRSKCAYCDFNSLAGCSDASVLSYLSALNTEIKYAGEKFVEAQIGTVYIGGGTPSLLKESEIVRIAENIRKYFKTNIAEFTIEVNPESITESKLKAYLDAGINRISVGVQSLNEDNLRGIGRIHDAAQATAALKLAAKYFTDISADLIVGLPYDTPKIIQDEVSVISELAGHVSVYELTLEEGTPLYEKQRRGEVLLPCDDEVQDHFEIAAAQLCGAGFERYEISNFCLPGKRSKHNFGYWTREEYIGIGAGAHSLIKTADGSEKLKKEIRFASLKDINAYIAGVNCGGCFDNVPRTEISVIDEREVEKEQIMLGLRTSDGIDSRLLSGKDLSDLKRFFIFDNGRAALNDKGMAVMNSVLARLI